jgi:lysophospholipase L1-like esterase
MDAAEQLASVRAEVATLQSELGLAGGGRDCGGGSGTECVKLLCFGDSLTAGCDIGLDKESWPAHRYPEVCQKLLQQGPPTAEEAGVQTAFEMEVIGASGAKAQELWDKRQGGGTDVNGVPYKGLRQALAAGQLDAVFIQLGTNDLADVIEITDTAKNEEIIKSTVTAVQQLHELCHAEGVKTIAMPIPPQRYSTSVKLHAEERHREQLDRFRAAHRKINNQLQQWAAARPGLVLWLDVWATARGRELGDYDIASTQAVPLWSDFLHLSAAGYQVLGTLVAEAPGLRAFLTAV